MPPSKSQYEVERILTHKEVRGQTFYFIKWRNFGSPENTWEPEENLNCPRLLRKYFISAASRNVKSRQSFTLPSGSKAAKTGRNSRVTLAWRKSSLQSLARKNSKASVDSRALRDVAEDRRKSTLCSQADDSQKPSLDPLATEIPSEGSQITDVHLQASKRRKLSLDLPRELASKVAPRYSLDVQGVSNASTVPAARIEAQPGHTKNVPANWSEAKNDPQLVDENQNSAATPSQLVDSKIDSSRECSSAIMSSPKADSPKDEKLLSSLGLTMLWPSIKISKFDENGSFRLDKREQLKRLGLVEVGRPFADSNVPRRGRPKRPTPKPARRTNRQRHPVVDLTTDSEPLDWSLASDHSWQNSTVVGRKFPNKLQVRLFDRTPRPEVLESVPFLDTFDSESNSEFVNDSSDKENLPKRRGRPAKRRPTAPRLAVKPSRRRSKLPEVVAEDLPQTEALVLLTEQNAAGGSNMMVFFRRLNLVKSIPEHMADKYYSQAVIDFYRRSTQPRPRVSRRSF